MNQERVNGDFRRTLEVVLREMQAEVLQMRSTSYHPLVLTDGTIQLHVQDTPAQLLMMGQYAAAAKYDLELLKLKMDEECGELKKTMDTLHARLFTEGKGMQTEANCKPYTDSQATAYADDHIEYKNARARWEGRKFEYQRQVADRQFDLDTMRTLQEAMRAKYGLMMGEQGQRNIHLKVGDG